MARVSNSVCWFQCAQPLVHHTPIVYITTVRQLLAKSFGLLIVLLWLATFIWKSVICGVFDVWCEMVSNWIVRMNIGLVITQSNRIRRDSSGNISNTNPSCFVPSNSPFLSCKHENSLIIVHRRQLKCMIYKIHVLRVNILKMHAIKLTTYSWWIMIKIPFKWLFSIYVYKKPDKIRLSP